MARGDSLNDPDIARVQHPEVEPWLRTERRAAEMRPPAA